MKISIKSVNKNFGTKNVLNNVSFEANPGEITGLIGANGSGKTTLLRCITDIYDYTGAIQILHNENKVSEKEVNIAFIQDNDSISLNLTGYQYCKFVANYNSSKNFGKIEEKRLVELAQLFRIDDALEKNITNYSHGMIKKISIIANLIANPDIIIFDEPFNGLDPEFIEFVKRLLLLLKSKGKTVLITSHILSIVGELADKFVLMDKGFVKMELSKNEFAQKYRGKSIEEIWLNLLNIEDDTKIKLDKINNLF